MMKEKEKRKEIFSQNYGDNKQGKSSGKHQSEVCPCGEASGLGHLGPGGRVGVGVGVDVGVGVGVDMNDCEDEEGSVEGRKKENLPPLCLSYLVAVWRQDKGKEEGVCHDDGVWLWSARQKKWKKKEEEKKTLLLVGMVLLCVRVGCGFCF